ncbi:HbrB-like protein [Dothidotthia symphoricarpi CBS 119687]|uniref:HbrB-like protein n=1 Tax=Dothidotthia symphoricarpi CBS 119687 TaxID=1392245 RepID=A0A6A6AIH2_9PLEO|nr:HbrB-like protein [Dothidotthia symphoricarpi CBS 119687]KAF2130704.1 HbrB-like protein [Dothidotthia symphoricarpi CBS 119687]
MPSSSPPPQTPAFRHSLDESDSDASQATLQQRRSPMAMRPPTADAVHNYSRPGMIKVGTNESGMGHRPRQRSQGYFEPSLSSAREGLATGLGMGSTTGVALGSGIHLAASASHLTASQIAAQAAYAQTAQHARQRSTTIPAPGEPAVPAGRGQPLSPPPMSGAQSLTFRTNGMTYQNGVMGANRMAATTAANAAYPRSPLNSPGMDQVQTQPQPLASPKQASTPEPPKAPKEKSKMKLFSSKPKNIKVDKEMDKRQQPLPSPGKIGIGIHSSQALNRMMNQSTTSLIDSGVSSSNASMYSSANASTSTLVPRNDAYLLPEKEKEKHKHHFLSRQKHKLKDKDDHVLPLSSASSTSRPTDPNSPAPLYSFAAPSSPGPSSSFASSVTGLDLRHGGRNLRRAKKEEKAAAYLDAHLEPPYKERNQSFSIERAEWPIVSGSLGTTPSLATPATVSHTTEMLSLGSSFGINGLSPDDAWPLLKARVLLIFEGHDPRPPVEDFNALVIVHIKRCMHKRSPIIIIEDLNELLQTGFGSLDQTLRHIPDESLIPDLVETWLLVFSSILPFMQAVFMPLDLEFRGTGIMSSAQAAEFWGVMLPDEMNTKSPENKNIPILGELEVRRITLLMFRDMVILPRYDTLMAIFSRLSLESLNAGLESPAPMPDHSHHHHNHRPGTASSAHDASNANSHSSSSASHLENTHSTPSSTFASSRSRATSNTSAGSFSSIHAPAITPTTSNTTTTTTSTINLLHAPPPPSSLRHQPMGSAKVTETVGRMLQCVSVLVSLQSGDEAQDKIGRLNKELKYNWLGRGRTGRQRQGFVGRRMGAAVGGGVGVVGA